MHGNLDIFSALLTDAEATENSPWKSQYILPKASQTDVEGTKYTPLKSQYIQRETFPPGVRAPVPLKIRVLVLLNAAAATD